MNSSNKVNRVVLFLLISGMFYFTARTTYILKVVNEEFDILHMLYSLKHLPTTNLKAIRQFNICI